ncbi:MAG: spore protease YyaC [Bacillota bacterium]|uniref:Putative sporulation protein YyaC n=2 Tax=Carboxydocella TaxID=178898 RepID=A0A1T4RRB6_9FIRM|nr:MULTISPECIES: spore protease YyaC [Carboxydocella]AVX21886.1 putative sporulation protein YyaC [Carboxydocella thermautotrophica]AVX32289.1 putative sporulation protein YyaC [Carboxydocella thermautotrophica]SKA18308.1 putative sporulation protein YyaC [Carboxydocella sporoproducens DSM 16521]GAW28071.1 spore protease YyaC [Carboxydocella sp. ULO1]GAW32539.1 spore protease YyaC [Carboxydocella sp. JDF658]
MEKHKIHVDDPLVVDKLSRLLVRQLVDLVLPGQPILILCIGTDRSTGDALGPLIGTLLSQKPCQPFWILGTLEEPVHAANLAEKLQHIYKTWPNPFVIAIDASLGNLDSVGHITLARGPLKPGAGVNKNLPPVGQIHLTGIVNVGGFMEYFVLQNTRLFVVMKMAQAISSALSLASRLWVNFQDKYRNTSSSSTWEKS